MSFCRSFPPEIVSCFFFGSLVSHSKHVVVVVVVVEGRKGTATDQLVADEDVAGVLLRVGLLGDEAEELLLGLVVGAVRDAVQRVLVQDPLQKRRQQNQKKNPKKNKQNVIQFYCETAGRNRRWEPVVVVVENPQKIPPTVAIESSSMAATGPTASSSRANSSLFFCYRGHRLPIISFESFLMLYFFSNIDSASRLLPSSVRVIR